MNKPHDSILHLILSRIGCFISASENIGVSTPVPVTHSSSSVQHLGYGARDVFPFDKNDRAAIGPQRSGKVEFGRRQATFQRVVLFKRTNRELLRSGWGLKEFAVSPSANP